jgi:hypothetical protein
MGRMRHAVDRVSLQAILRCHLAVAIIYHGRGPPQALISHQVIQQGSHPREVRGVVDVDRSRQGLQDPIERLTWQARAVSRPFACTHRCTTGTSASVSWYRGRGIDASLPSTIP